MEGRTVTVDPLAEATQQPIDPASHRLQLSLRTLLWATTWFAISSAAAARWGFGTFVPATGMLLAVLNFRGAFRFLQHSAGRPRLLLGVWFLFLMSLVLPTAKGCGSAAEPLYGWQAAVSTVHLAAHAASDWQEHLGDAETAAEGWGQVGLMALTVAMWNLPHLALLLSPVVLLRRRAVESPFFGLLAAWGAASCWRWGLHDSGNDLLVGYYVWSAAITGLTLAYRPGWKTVLSVVALVALSCFEIQF